MNMQRGVLLVAAPLVAACSGVPASTDGGFAAPAPHCVARTGVYTYQESFVSGDCGPADPPTVFNLADSLQSAPSMPFYLGEKVGAGGSAKVEDYFACCSGAILVSTDNCAIEYSLRAPLKDGGSGRVAGKITWAMDGRSAKGTMNFTALSAASMSTCTGDYAVSVTK